LIVLSLHSLQAPGFYLRNGYHEVARIDDHPAGHTDVFLAKRLDADHGAPGSADEAERQ